MARLGHSLNQQLKLDGVFNNVSVKREIIKDFDNLQIYINDKLWFDEDKRLQSKNPGLLPYAANHIINMKKEFKI